MAQAAPQDQKFWGTTENAVKIQVYAAMTAYSLVAIAHHDLKLEISTYEMLEKIERNSYREDSSERTFR